jgi:hypothetical protein
LRPPNGGIVDYNPARASCARIAAARALGHHSAMLRALLAWMLAAAAASVSAQSIVRCVDVNGNVTYQDAPCTKGEAGRSVDLPKAETREDTTAWEEAARAGRVVRGMPKRWVLRAKGAPYEIRPPAAREEASEVWRYAGPAIIVGFAGPNVAWVRDDTSPAPATAKPAAPAAAAASAAKPKPSVQGAQNRKFVLPGRYCEHVFAEIGAADREETVSAPPASEDAQPTTETVKRYIYDPTEADPSMRTVFTCMDGKVVDVERTMVQ